MCCFVSGSKGGDFSISFATQHMEGTDIPAPMEDRQGKRGLRLNSEGSKESIWYSHPAPVALVLALLYRKHFKATRREDLKSAPHCRQDCHTSQGEERYLAFHFVLPKAASVLIPQHADNCRTLPSSQEFSGIDGSAENF